PMRAPRSASSRSARRFPDCQGVVRASPSSPSGPAMTSRISAASATKRDIGPWVSRYGQVGNVPVRGTTPNVGLKPTTPVNCAGILLEPPSSVPRPANTTAQAAPTEDPALEPPGE